MQRNRERSIPFCTEQVNDAVPLNPVLGNGDVDVVGAASGCANSKTKTPLKKVLRLKGRERRKNAMHGKLLSEEDIRV